MIGYLAIAGTIGAGELRKVVFENRIFVTMKTWRAKRQVLFEQSNQNDKQKKESRQNQTVNLTDQPSSVLFDQGYCKDHSLRLLEVLLVPSSLIPDWPPSCRQRRLPDHEQSG